MPRASLRFVDSCVNAVGGAYTQKPVYTRGGAYTHPLCVHTHRSRIRTDPRIHTRVHICTRCVYTPTTRVNAPIRVYAPWCVYAPAAVYTPCYRSRKRTYPRICTRRCVYAGTRRTSWNEFGFRTIAFWHSFKHNGMVSSDGLRSVNTNTHRRAYTGCVLNRQLLNSSESED